MEPPEKERKLLHPHTFKSFAHYVLKELSQKISQQIHFYRYYSGN